MRFRSDRAFRDPDVAGYEMQKKVKVIHSASEPLEELPSSLSKSWSHYYNPRLVLASKGRRGTHLTRFPGHTIPGAGAGENVRYTGSLAIERFEHLLELSGGLPVDGQGSPSHRIEPLPIIGWPWIGIEQPCLRVLHPVRNEHCATEVERLEFMAGLWVQADLMHRHGKFGDLLALVHRAWSTHTKAPTLDAYLWQIVEDQFKPRAHEKTDVLTLAFELEAITSHVEYSRELDLMGSGEYGGNWLEVGVLPLGKIHGTELAVTKRVLAELVSVRTHGFAPIVVNEFGCDTDGTHRLIASWLWNLIQSINENDWNPHNPQLCGQVAQFVKCSSREMGLSVVRESLRSLAEILVDAEMRRVLETEVLPFVGQYLPITELPVVLLPEYSAGTVLKGPYDEGTASYRVDPTVYEQLAQDHSLVLPARGPYHLTDRALLPWFDILKRK